MCSLEQSPNAEHICSGRPWHCHMAGKYASYSSSTKGRVRNEKRKWVKMSENERVRAWQRRGGACARQREGREAEKSNSWRVRSGTCCPLGSADRSTPPPTTHTNVLNTPTRLNSYIHTRPGSNTDYVMTYISAKPYWSKMKKQMACWCDSTVWVSPLNLSDTLPSP